VVRDEFSRKEFKKHLGINVSKIVFPVTPSINSVYVVKTFFLKKVHK